MSEFVLLRLDQAFQPSTWLRCDLKTGPVGFSQSAQVPLPSGLKIIAVCASPELVLRFVQTPKQGRERFRRAIGFALEDSVVDDVDALSFVLPAQWDDSMQPVAVIQRERLEAVRAQLKELLGVHFDALLAVVPLPALLPADTVWVERSTSSFHFSSQDAATIESESLSAMLKLRQNSQGPLPLQLLLNDGLSLGKLPANFSSEALSEPNHYLAQRLLEQKHLLSLIDSPAQKRGLSLKLDARWRIVAMLVGLGLLLQTFAVARSYFALRSELSAQNDEIAQHYKTVLADTAPSLDPLASLLSKLKSDASEGVALQSGGALALLRKIAPVLYTETRLTLIRAEYRAAELELSFRSPDLATIDLLRTRLQTLDQLEVTLGNNNIDPNGQMLTGRIKIKQAEPGARAGASQ